MCVGTCTEMYAFTERTCSFVSTCSSNGGDFILMENKQLQYNG